MGVFGLSNHKHCPVCGNYTVSPIDDECKNAYCGEEEDDMANEQEFMRAEANNRDLTEDEQIIYNI